VNNVISRSDVIRCSKNIIEEKNFCRTLTEKSHVKIAMLTILQAKFLNCTNTFYAFE